VHVAATDVNETKLQVVHNNFSLFLFFAWLRHSKYRLESRTNIIEQDHN